MKVCDRIRIVRKSQRISQSQIASKIGVTVSSYNMKEKGRRPINTDEIEHIALVLEVPAAIFFDEKFHEKLKLFNREGTR